MLTESGTYCTLVSNKATDHVITDGLANVRAVLYKLSNVKPLVSSCLTLLTEVCTMLQISDLGLMTSANSTQTNEYFPT